MAEGITLKRIIDMDEATELSSSDYALVDSATGGPKKFALGEELSSLKEDLNTISDGVFSEQDLSPTASPTGYRLNESNGLCSANSAYKLVKWYVSSGINEGTVFHIHSDDRWQFQSAASVPSSGTSNRVGDTTFGSGDFYVTIPSGATYIIGSTPTNGSTFKVYRLDSMAMEALGNTQLNSPLYTLGKNTLLTINAYLRQDGIIETNSNYKTSDFIAVKQGQVIKYNLESNTSTAVICFYTNQCRPSISSYVAGTGTLSSGEFTAPADGYIRFSTSSSSLPNAYCYIEADTTPNFAPETAGKIFAGKKIVIIGDSIMAYSNVAATIASLTGATVINCAIGGSLLAYGTDAYNIICGARIAKGIENEDIASIDVSGLQLSYQNTQRWNELVSMDFSTVDMLVVSYGTNDFSYNIPLDSATPFDEGSIKTAVDYIIKVFNTKYPNTQLCFFTPCYRHRTAWNGDSDEVTNGIGKYLVDYEDAIVTACEENHVPCKAMYKTCGVNKYNYETYLDDGLHRTETGGELLGHQYAGFLEDNVI